MNPKVSVIIPVYNVEKYLERCLRSICNQTFKDIEIICVNDGSTDKSLEILNSFAQRDNRIKILDKINTGVSDCRNKALEIANGKYIMFVDSDDWINLNMIERLYEVAYYHKAEAVMCGYIREYLNGSKEKKIDLPQLMEYKNQTLIEFHRKLFGPLTSEMGNPESLDALVTVWGKLYKSSVIKDNKIKFIDLKTIGSNEDGLFNIQFFKYIKKAIFTNESLYHYWKENSNSITSKYNPYLLEQWNNLFTYMREEVKDSLYEEALTNRQCISVLGLGLNECAIIDKLSLKQRLKQWEIILRHNEIENAYKNFDYTKFPLHWRIFYFFNKYQLIIPSYCMLLVINYLRKWV